jgi:hypothetical protein
MTISGNYVPLIKAESRESLTQKLSACVENCRVDSTLDGRDHKSNIEVFSVLHL